MKNNICKPDGAGDEAILLGSRQAAPGKFSRVWGKEDTDSHCATTSSDHLVLKAN